MKFTNYQHFPQLLRNPLQIKKYWITQSLKVTTIGIPKIPQTLSMPDMVDNMTIPLNHTNNINQVFIFWQIQFCFCGNFSRQKDIPGGWSYCTGQVWAAATISGVIRWVPVIEQLLKREDVCYISNDRLNLNSERNLLIKLIKSPSFTMFTFALILTPSCVFTSGVTISPSGGYSDVIVRIDASIPTVNCSDRLRNLKTILSNSSSSLLTSLSGRAYFHSFIIIEQR